MELLSDPKILLMIERMEPEVAFQPSQRYMVKQIILTWKRVLLKCTNDINGIHICKLSL